MTDPLFLELQEALKGRYSLLNELGRGGMGIVYLAREVRLDRLVALKLLPPALAANPGLRERFLREARLAAQLSQPNIVPIFAADEAGPFVFYAMAHVDGDTLAEVLAKRGPLPPAEATRWLREVAWALAYAHGQRIVHRDIKPDNILIERGTGRALVTDFGIARVTDAESDSGGRAVGTPAYMSPEQLRGEPVDGRTDLYALGASGFAMLTGRLPFEGNAAAVMTQKLSRAAPPLLSMSPGTPPALARAVDRCLLADKHARFASAEELVAALEAASAQPSRLPAPLARWYVTGEELKASDAFLTTLATGPLFFLLELLVDGLRSFGHFDVVAALVVALTAPMTLWSVARLSELRRVLAAGFSRRDLVAALRQAAHARDADATDQGSAPFGTGLDRGMRYLAAAGLVGGGGVLAALIATDPSGVIEPIAAAYSVLASWVAASKVMPGGPGSFKRRVFAWRARFWESRLGRLIAKAAGRALPAGASPEALANRPTEFALGGAADALYDALPEDQRKQFPEVMGIVRRLESRAQAERAAGDDAALAEAVTALENIRLDLLRLGAGIAARPGVTEDLDAARRIGAGVDAALDGRQAADDALRSPTPA
jgi:serine/threonine-protein kinase